MREKDSHVRHFKDLKRKRVSKVRTKFLDKYNKRYFVCSLALVFFSLCIYSSFIRASYLKVNKDLADSVIYIKDKDRIFNLTTGKLTQSDIEFKKEHSLERKLLLGEAKGKCYVLNVAAVNNFDKVKLEISRLKSKSLEAMYIKGESVYYIVVGRFGTLESTEIFGLDLFKKGVIKNYYARYIS